MPRNTLGYCRVCGAPPDEVCMCDAVIIAPANCEECAGDGFCFTCGGDGRVLVRALGSSATCPECGGSGNCPECDGTGRMRIQ